MSDRPRSALIGAAFLMATSAIGPGFLTQTAVFTEKLGASFGFAILASIVIDHEAQLTIWRVIAASGRRAGPVADAVLPGLGTALTILVVLGGLAFNVGNVAGAGLGLEVVAGIPVTIGAVLSAVLAIGLFVVKEAGRAMDRFSIWLGFVLIALTLTVALASGPPVGEAIVRTVLPTQIDVLSVVTIVGGTVGGYITFAGAHRLIDAGVTGPAAVPQVTRSAATAIGVASLMRIILFLAVLGVVHQGVALDPANPPASVFRAATGDPGYRLFGIVMWSAAITSVVGAAYTSVSFLRSLHSALDRQWPRVVTGFIALSTLVFVLIGRPVKTLLLVGALNGLILPLGLAAMLAAAQRPTIVGAYRHPRWLTGLGLLIALVMTAAGGYVLVRDLPALLR
ncbi:MAG: NRAMP family divalent metal transporter [Gemmatimonadota bacterium]